MVLSNILTYVDAKSFTIRFSTKTRLAIGIASVLYASYQINCRLKNKNHEKYKEIPMPSEKLPILGHLLSMGGGEPQVIAKIEKWHKKLGPIIKLKLGVQTWIFVEDPLLAHKIFVAHGASTSGRPNFVYRYNNYSNGKGAAFSQPDARWRKARSFVLAAIAPNKINLSEDFIKEEAKALVQRLLRIVKTRGGQMFPLQQIQLSTFNIGFKFLVGRTFDSIEDEEFKVLSEVLDESLELEDLKYEIPNFFPALYYPLHHISGKEKMKNWNERFYPAMLNLIKSGIANDEKCLVKLAYEKEPELTDEELVLTMDFLGGSSDTSLITIMWLIKFMIIRPDVQEKAATEIKNFTSSKGRLPYFDERNQLPYCICVLKESMRLRPTVPFGVPHTATEDIEVDGYFIPKGSSILSSMRSMHKNSSFFSDDPEEFKPDRYMNNLKTMHAAANGKVEERDHFNFGWGRRRCPAPYLAEMELFHVFTTLLSECCIEPAASGLPDMNADKKAFFEAKFIKRFKSSQN